LKQQEARFSKERKVDCRNGWELCWSNHNSGLNSKEQKVDYRKGWELYCWNHNSDSKWEVQNA
jgi:hypothetical protein